jgi:hypothetical protein
MAMKVIFITSRARRDMNNLKQQQDQIQLLTILSTAPSGSFYLSSAYPLAVLAALEGDYVKLQQLNWLSLISCCKETTTDGNELM